MKENCKHMRSDGYCEKIHHHIESGFAMLNHCEKCEYYEEKQDGDIIKKKNNQFKKFIGVRILFWSLAILGGYVLVDMLHISGWLSVALITAGSVAVTLFEYVIYDKKVFVKKEGEKG